MEVTVMIKITDECIACGVCESECPIEAICEGDPIYTINQTECTECATCLDMCPTDAIVEE